MMSQETKEPDETAEQRPLLLSKLDEAEAVGNEQDLQGLNEKEEEKDEEEEEEEKQKNEGNPEKKGDTQLIELSEEELLALHIEQWQVMGLPPPTASQRERLDRLRAQQVREANWRRRRQQLAMIFRAIPIHLKNWLRYKWDRIRHRVYDATHYGGRVQAPLYYVDHVSASVVVSFTVAPFFCNTSSLASSSLASSSSIWERSDWQASLVQAVTNPSLEKTGGPSEPLFETDGAGDVAVLVFSNLTRRYVCAHLACQAIDGPPLLSETKVLDWLLAEERRRPLELETAEMTALWKRLASTAYDQPAAKNWHAQAFLRIDYRDSIHHDVDSKQCTAVFHQHLRWPFHALLDRRLMRQQQRERAERVKAADQQQQLLLQIPERLFETVSSSKLRRRAVQLRHFFFMMDEPNTTREAENEEAGEKDEKEEKEQENEKDGRVLVDELFERWQMFSLSSASAAAAEDGDTVALRADWFCKWLHLYHSLDRNAMLGLVIEPRFFLSKVNN
jgi:hypothetical protein